MDCLQGRIEVVNEMNNVTLMLVGNKSSICLTKARARRNYSSLVPEPLFLAMAMADSLGTDVEALLPGWTEVALESIQQGQLESEDSAVADACRLSSSGICSSNCYPCSEDDLPVPSPEGFEFGIPIALSPQTSDDSRFKTLIQHFWMHLYLQIYLLLYINS